MTTCTHEAFTAQVAVGRIAEITVCCASCGLSFAHPTVNVDATTLHAPIAPGPGELASRLRFEVPS